MKKNTSIIIITVLLIALVYMLYLLFSSDKSIDDENNKIANNEEVSITKIETNDKVMYNVIDSKKGITYSWTFDKTEEYNKSLKENIEIDVNLNISLLDKLYNSELDDKVKNRDKLIVSFDHHGKLPSKAKITLDVKDRYNEGERLYLYYYNEEDNQIEFIENDLIVNRGKVVFEIEHCSNYLLTGSIVQDAINNPQNINIVIIVMVVAIIVLIAATLFQNRK